MNIYGFVHKSQSVGLQIFLNVVRHIFEKFEIEKTFIFFIMIMNFAPLSLRKIGGEKNLFLR